MDTGQATAHLAADFPLRSRWDTGLVQIMTLEQQQLLGFVRACNRHGYSPTSTEVMDWLTSPLPAEAEYERRKRQALSTLDLTGGLAGEITRNLNSAAWAALADAALGPTRKAMAEMASQLQANMATRLWEADSYETVETQPAETPVDHLVRIGWLSGKPSDGGSAALALTPLGRALLASAEEEDDDSQERMVILGSDDPLAYPTLIGRLSEMGPALLIDPYLKLDQLHHIVSHTGIDRVLVTGAAGHQKHRTAMSTYLQSVSARAVEVRASTDLHDRLVIPTDGITLMLGASLDGVGRKTTVLSQLPESAASALREEHERLWSDATQVATSIVDAEPDVDDA